MTGHQERVEAAALAVVACPPGGWPETQQAMAQFVDVAGRWAWSAKAGKNVYRVPDVVCVARKAIERGATRPARAGEWGL